MSEATQRGFHGSARSFVIRRLVAAAGWLWGLGLAPPPPQYSASFKATHSPPPSPSAKRPPVLAGPCWTERTVYRQITNPFSLLLYLTRSNSPGPSVRGILFR